MKSQVVVAGASPHDLLLYPTQTSSDQENRRIFQTVKSERGARLVADLLRSALDEQTFAVYGPATFPATEEDENCLNSIIELEVASDIRHQSFRVKHAHDIYTQPIWLPPAIVPGKGDRVSALVLQDADSEFTNCENAVDVIRSIIRKSTPDFIIYRMISPLGASQIWDAVRPSSHGLDEHLATDKLVVVVSADDLRADGVELGYSMSWEKTCEDFVSNLGSNGQLDTLVTCAHLVVLFGCDGVIYHRGRQMAQPTLFFDPQSEEGGHERRHGGHIPGYMEAFVANLTAEIAESPEMNLEHAIRRGLSGARCLTRMGYRSTDLHEWPKYPVSEIMSRDDDLQSSESALITISIPAESISQGKAGEWSILEHNIGDPVLMAHYIVVEGVLSAAQWIPIAQFGELAALDRVEIESFRAMFNAINTYMSSEQTKPLNFGIFGGRGSGKSFAAVQVASSGAMANGRQVQRFDIYLSPTSKTDDLVNALNAIRDCTLSGRLPIVYFNGFDNPMENIPFGWLDYLLPPLLAGKFLDRGEMRHTGPAIFLLSSVTVERFAELDLVIQKTDNQTYARKIQELVSCLHGHVDVLGFDRLDEADTLYPVRRAVALRHLLEERETALQVSGRISIDQSVLDGLLLIPTYRHGYRSLKSIITMSNLTGKHHFERASLPPSGQLSLHLDYELFMRCSHYNLLSTDILEFMGRGLHETYVPYRLSMAKTKEEKEELEAQTSLNSWDFLDEEFKESARAHAADIPRKLRFIHCFMSKTNSHRRPVTKFELKEIELLAEREHERWNAERLQKQWRLGERNETQRVSPFLVPWRDLAKIWQDIDRVLVDAYPNVLPHGYAIYRVGKITDPNLKSSSKILTRRTV